MDVTGNIYQGEIIMFIDPIEPYPGGGGWDDPGPARDDEDDD